MIFVISIFNIKITLGGNIPKDNPSQQNIMLFSGDKVDSASTFFPLLRDTNFFNFWCAVGFGFKIPLIHSLFYSFIGPGFDTLIYYKKIRFLFF